MVSLLVTLGTVVFLILTLIAVVPVSIFWHYNKTYGELAGVIVLLLWLFLTCYIVLFETESNAAAEPDRARHQHRKAEADGAARSSGR